MMSRNKILALFLTIAMCIAMLPAGVYAEDPPGTATVTTEAEFLDALDDPAVTHIIAESMELKIEQDIVLEKDLTIANSASLNIADNGMLTVAEDATLTLNGNTTIQWDGALHIRGTLINNATLSTSGFFTAVGPATVTNNGSLESVDPRGWHGRIGFTDIIVDTGEQVDDYGVDSVNFTDNDLTPTPNENIVRTADVNGPNSLRYAMGAEIYDNICLSEFQDANFTYFGDLTITKPVDLLENDSLIVNGNLTISAPEGGLFLNSGSALKVTGNLTILPPPDGSTTGGELFLNGDSVLVVIGDLINDNFMYIEGTLTVTGTATNNGYYIQTEDAVVDAAEIIDAGEGDHMRGYYVANQEEWEAALADSAHCNPIVITLGEPITVSTDTTITSNLFIWGDLTIEQGVTFNLNKVNKKHAREIMNNLSGTLVNRGTLNLNTPLDICGTLENYGTINMAGYDGDENGDWTTDGHIFLYTEWNEGGNDSQSGLLTNAGFIFNENSISINHDARMVNTESGLIDNYGCIESWDGIDETNIYPLANRGLIWNGEIDFEYEGLFFTWTDWRNLEGGEYYPVPVKDEQGNPDRNTTSFPVVGDETCVFYYRYYDEQTHQWANRPINASELAAYDFSENPDPTADIIIEEWADLDPEVINGITDPDFTEYEFTKVNYTKFDNYMFIYNAGTPEAPEIYILPVSVQLPLVGYYSAPSTIPAEMGENNIREFSYIPTAPMSDKTFYAIVNVPEGFSLSSYEVNGDQVDVARSDEQPNVFEIKVKDGISYEFYFNFAVQLQDNTNPDDTWDANNWIRVYPGEHEGLFVVWADWKEAEGIHYPALTRDPIYYDSYIHTLRGDYVLAFFYKHRVGDEASGYWDYTPVSPDDLIVSGESGITKELWTHENIGNIPADDGQYHDYLFTSIDFSLFGDFTIGYQADETTYEMTAHIALPGLGAYTDPVGGEANWLRDVDFSRYREVYLLPFEVNMAGADLSKSEFVMRGRQVSRQLTYDSENDVFLMEDGGGGAYLRVEPYRDEGAIKYFTLAVFFTPFEPDFNLEFRIRDDNNNEIVNNNIYFYAPIDEAWAIGDDGQLATPVPENDTGVTVEDLAQNSVKYYSFTAGSLLPGQAYLFKLEGSGEPVSDRSDRAKIYLFDQDWKFLSESNWEDLREEGRAASLGTADLAAGETYKVAVYNGSAEPCDFLLTASVRDVPGKPTVDVVIDENLGVSQFRVSGATDGQGYEIYAKIGDEWRHRGTQDFDTESDYRFWNVFDVIDDGETVTAVRVAINNGGVQGEMEELSFAMERTDTDGTPMDVKVLHYPESREILITAAEGVFENGVYHRLRHERPNGFWDFHSSFIGNGTNMVFCESDGELENAEDPEATGDGRYIVASYSESETDHVLHLGWKYRMNVEQTGEGTTGIGSFDYERPKTWLAVGEEDFDQNNRGRIVLEHSFSDGRTKFRLVTYDKDAAGDKYTFSQPLHVSDGLTTSPGLTLTDMTGEEAEFVKFSPNAMGDYIVSYTDGNTIYRAIISISSPATGDTIECEIDGAAGTADVNVDIQSLRGREGETVNAIFALYEKGRMVGIETRSPKLHLNGFNESVRINFNPLFEPDTCRVFILDQGSYSPIMQGLVKKLTD